ncbi:MAG: hypothetical protein WCE62_04455 [Polyangiales bacterium]
MVEADRVQRQLWNMAELDRPQSGMITVTQQPLQNLRGWMSADLENPSASPLH